MIFKRSDNVPLFDDYRWYRDAYLRPDFHYRCAYCLIHEQLFLEEGGGEIDHHRPLNPPEKTGKDFRYLRNAYRNLYWTCGRCNLNKGSRWPTDLEYESGNRFLDPCAEDHHDHWDTNTDGSLTPKTDIGRYTVGHIRLNRRFLITMRQRFFERRKKIADIGRLLVQSTLSPADNAEITKILKDDFLLNPPAFEI